MKSLLAVGLVAGVVSVAGLASAQHNPAHSKGNGMQGVGHTSHGNGNGYGHYRDAASVPEFDPSAAGAALALLLGGTAILMGARRTNE